MFALYYKKVPILTPKTWLLLYKGVVWIVSLLCVLFLTEPAQAQTVVFSDSFELGYQKWEPTRDVGDLWSIHDGQLHGYVPLGFTISELVPKDAYWNSEWKNIRYELDFLALAGADKNISFHFENLNNWYEIHFNHGGMEILRVQDGAVPWKSQRPTTLQNNVQYHITLELNDGRVILYIDNELIFDEIDPSYNNNHGKIGLKVGTGSIAPTHIVVDNVQVTLLNTNNRLGVELVSQLDTEWASIEYDSASRWNPDDSTIGSWGCALSSMVMILDFHGITDFEDGNPITPATLNTWLNTQADGYIGDGLLNWLAVTRLTNQLSGTYQTPSLEFSLAVDEITQTLQTELQTALRPAIVQIPGHFLVADGMVPDTEVPDFYIQDPYYTYTQLSEHTTQPISLRLFTPSFTDLSYFLFTSNEASETEFALSKDTQSVPLIGTTSYLESELDASLTTQVTSLNYVQKPDSGRYTLTLTGPWAQPYEINLYTYSTTGESTVHKLTGIHSSGPTTYLLNYNKETGQSEIQLQNAAQSLQNDLNYLFENQEITSHFVWYELNRLVALMNVYASQKDQLKHEFDTYLLENTPTLSASAFTYLRTKSGLL